LTRVGYTSAEAGRIAYQLVYGYTHHPFPIDLNEAARVGLRAQHMDKQEHAVAAELLAYCAGDDLFIGFVDEYADSHRQEAAPAPGVQVKADQQLPPTAEAAQDGEDQAIALPRDQVTGAVEEGQRFTASGRPAPPNTPGS
jgi:hypothetical protein